MGDTSGSVAVIGGGPAGLMAAEVLASAGAAVTVFERMPSVGRKFQLAGRGGLNLTHSEPLHDIIPRYGPARDRLGAALGAFTPDDLRAWCAGLDQDTFVGSSGRVFPKGFRATALLRSWLRRLDGLGVELRVRHTWRGWDRERSGAVVFWDAAGETVTFTADATVLALGGASWPRTGSDGGWVELVRAAGIEVRPLRPANCGFSVSWTGTFSERFQGSPLKNVTLSFGRMSVRGEALITATGIEGGAVYALSSALRDAIDTSGPAVVHVDLRPDISVEQLTAVLARRRPKDSASTALRRAGFSPVAVALLREVVGGPPPRDGVALARLAKAVPIVALVPQPLARAISTAGGIALAEVDEGFMLRRRPGTFVAGEMLDWEAPTGGYLLQGAFSTAVVAARAALAWLASP